MNASQKDNTLKIVLIVVGGFLALILLGAVAIFALSFFVYQRTAGEAQTRFAEIRMQTVLQSAEVFKVQHGRYPRSTEELLKPPSGKPLLDEAPKDPWGLEMRLVVEGDRARVMSAGEDGQWGTSDDVTTSP